MQPRPSVQRREVGAAAPRHQQWIPVCRWAGSPDRAQLSSTVGRIRAAAPEVAIVMLTMINDSEVLATAIRAGAVGYVLKDAEQEELLHVIQAAARGELLFGASVAERARLLLHPKTGPWSPPLPELSDRERSILDQLAAGAPIAQIARTLHLSEKSVRNYLTVIPRRLGVTDRTASIARAREAGLGR